MEDQARLCNVWQSFLEKLPFFISKLLNSEVTK